MMYSGVPQEKRARAEVAVLCVSKWREGIISYKWISKRIVQVRCRLDRGNIIRVDASEEEKKGEIEMLYENLQEVLNASPKNDYIIVGSDLNTRIKRMPINNLSS